MPAYKDDLVELANQAWILNFSLAELHRFKSTVERHLSVSSALRNDPSRATDQGLQQDLLGELLPAMARLQTRLQALLSKWQRRMHEASATPVSDTAPEPITIQAEPWGCRLDVPPSIRQQMRVTLLPPMSLADARALAARHADDFFTLAGPRRSGAVDPTDDAAERVSVTQYCGVDLNVSKMWWSWYAPDPWPRCRLQVVSQNLWWIDSFEQRADKRLEQ